MNEITSVANVLKLLFKRFGIKYRSDILVSMREHPHFPNYASLKYVLRKEGIDSIVFESSIEELRDKLPKPVLVCVGSNPIHYLIVINVDDVYVHFLNEHDDTDNMAINEFINIWDGNAMIFDSENINPRIVNREERAKSIMDKLKVPFLFFSTLSFFMYLLYVNFESRHIANFLFMIISFIGLFFSILLLIENFDKHNPLIKKICTPIKNKKVECSSILNSKDAYFLGLVSWSDIGFLFFSFIFLVNLISPESLSRSMTITLSLLSFPFVFYSIIYQKYVALSWCRLCLGVVGVMTSLFIVSLIFISSYNFDIFRQFDKIITMLLLMFMITSMLIVTKSIMRKSYKLENIETHYKILKHNSDVKTMLFQKQALLSSSSEYALICGNSNGKTCITLIIGSICNHCINELRTLIPILREKENTRVEVFFLTVNKDIDSFAFNLSKTLISKYLVETNDFLDILDDFVRSYPVSKFIYSKQIDQLVDKKAEKYLIGQMDWCNKNSIYSAPRVFINSRALPIFYAIKDIDYMCS